MEGSCAEKIPTVSVRFWESVGSQLHWFCTDGTLHRDFGPLFAEERQKASSLHCSTIEEPPGATLLCVL